MLATRVAWPYDPSHMDDLGAELDWTALLAMQPALGCIPHALRSSARQVKAEAGQVLFRVGDPVRQVFLVVAGEARLFRFSSNGTEVVLQRARGGFFAEASLDSRRYHCEAVASVASTLWAFPATLFRQRLEESAAFRRAWQSLLAQEIRRLRAQCERLSLNGAADRVIHYIECEGIDGEVMLHQSRKSWAAELGLSHEALYRTLRNMQHGGILHVNGARLALRQ